MGMAFALPRVQIVYSTSHLLVPKIMAVVLTALLVLILLTEGIARKKKGEKLSLKGKHFFAEGYDSKKFWGTVVLSVVYLILLDLIRFVPASLICIFLYGVIFEGKKEKKSMVVSGVLSVCFTVFVWFIFGYVFNITLP
ncbi:tripartite tricarboxylate transporter TctB family protein [Clostridium sp. AM58-1XD]|uniref:tripartite tricarboxylate transporter TctB family protein n=1 Tax=Clostridium sp. AM58-1XD TaxID=2292307 RepID=UPI000E469E7E|nr:tripartite tricarboxylate transporter TctB family protein [Clostridium sp. AM58-1XD]RGY99029.1 tripartite tricarboxylate transporter TctB family protein [Clostridium sp. AM58-1XD]